MKMIFLILFFSLASCSPAIKSSDYLISFDDSATGGHGYKNSNGDIVIMPGKYSVCFTDTFVTYAIVEKPNFGIVAIDRKENILYQVFTFDNGPDYVSDGLFRILENNKIGFADSMTGKVVITPRFDCAWPFETGVARVSTDCKTQQNGEHTVWISDHWYYIDKKGKITD